jgi:hypothetical protein
MHTFIAQYLPEEPPAWALQIITEAALAKPNYQTPVVPETRWALAQHLEHTYRLTEPLLNEDGQFVDREFTAALAACELLYLYDYEGSVLPVQAALTWHVQRQLDRFDRDRLPEGAQRQYDLCMELLQQIGRKLNKREKITQGLGGLLSPKTTETDAETDTEGGPEPTPPPGTAPDALFDQDTM